MSVQEEVNLINQINEIRDRIKRGETASQQQQQHKPYQDYDDYNRQGFKASVHSEDGILDYNSHFRSVDDVNHIQYSSTGAFNSKYSQQNPSAS